LKKTLGIALTATAAVFFAAWSGAFSSLISTNYLPHRFCYLAQPGLIWTNVVMDGLIAASYALIFGCLFWIASRLRYIPAMRNYLWIFIAFGTFIIACGATHFMEIITVWWPVYRLSAAVKVLCAAASVPTAILFLRAAPVLNKTIHNFVITLSATQQQKDQALVSLVAAEKLAVAGRISASIAHEIKNPLDSIGNLLYILRSSPEASSDTLSLITIAESELNRASHIASNTLALYRESAAPVSLSLADLVQSIIDLQAPGLISREITLHSSINAPKSITAYPGELRQIVINLVQNAIAAVGNGGQIFVRVRPRHTLHSPQSPGYVITIADNGSGITPADRNRLFTLFFTTKGEQGTGLGLWLVQSLVARQGGHIRVRSRTAAESRLRGTLFQIWLPLHNPAGTTPKSSNISSSATTRQ
jgi:signal transduction histidine kinase